jgi:Flp pilus assembly protein TadG
MEIRQDQKGNGMPAKKRIWSLRKNDEGSVAVEFALISIPFFAFLFALIETALVFFASVGMEGAMEDAARMLRTGVGQSNGITAEQFRNEICDRSPLFFDCDQRLVIDVRTFDDFGGVAFSDPLDAGGNLANDFQFNPGGASDVVLVRAFYIWEVITPIGIGLENMSGGNRLLTTSAVFRNEPFGAILGGG